VALQPDEHYLWVGYDSPPEAAQVSGVAVIETRGPTVVKSIPTGRGHHEIAFSPDDRFAFVTNQGDGTLSVIDVRNLERIKQLDIGSRPVSIAYSPAGRAVYVANQGDGTIAVVNGESHEVTARIQAEPGLGQIKFAPDGRLGFIVNPEKSVLYILDPSVNRIIQSGGVEEGPDQVAFSDHLAYIRHRESELVLMVPLDKVGHEGQPIPTIDFPGGQRPFGRASRASLADAIVQAPGATAVLVANAGDKAIYYYKEGMAAPMGNFQNYSREPRAVIAVDRSLEERSPGSYETVAQLRRPGIYDVAFFLDSPRTVHCFVVDVAPNPELAAQRLKVRPIRAEPTAMGATLSVGKETVVTFRLTDADTGEPRDDLADVSILTFRSPGVARTEQPAQSLGEGIYGIRFVPQDPGVYYCFVRVPSGGLEYNESSFAVMRAEQPSQDQAASPGGGQEAPAHPGKPGKEDS
jgi:YVTN family beta-propeller protein